MFEGRLRSPLQETLIYLIILKGTVLINMEPKLLAFLRALYNMYEFMHWMTKCNYGSHLLFQRIYEGIDDEIDKVAEKIIGVEGDVLKPMKNMTLTLALFQKFFPDDTPCERYMEKAIVAEEKLLDYIAELMESDQTDGSENLLQGIADLHEEHLYLLKRYSKKEANVLNKLVALATQLDQKGFYEEANEIDSIIEEGIG